ncbi:MAG: hypothetical protein ABFS17_15190, partial [Chloroflexota bacterium]
MAVQEDRLTDKAAEIKVINSSLELFEEFGRCPQGEYLNLEGNILLITGVAHPMVNSVVQTHLEKNGIEAKIQGLVD